MIELVAFIRLEGVTIFLTCFSYFSHYFHILVFSAKLLLTNVFVPYLGCAGIQFLGLFLVPLALPGSTLYMQFQISSTAWGFLKVRCFLPFTKGFWCKRPLGESKSYLSYSQKSSDQHFLAWHKPRWATQYSPGWNPQGIFNSWSKLFVMFLALCIKR